MLTTQLRIQSSDRVVLNIDEKTLTLTIISENRCVARGEIAFALVSTCVGVSMLSFFSFVDVGVLVEKAICLS